MARLKHARAYPKHHNQITELNLQLHAFSCIADLNLMLKYSTFRLNTRYDVVETC